MVRQYRLNPWAYSIWSYPESDWWGEPIPQIKLFFKTADRAEEYLRNEYAAFLKKEIDSARKRGRPDLLPGLKDDFDNIDHPRRGWRMFFSDLEIRPRWMSTEEWRKYAWPKHPGYRPNPWAYRLWDDFWKDWRPTDRPSLFKTKDSALDFVRQSYYREQRKDLDLLRADALRLPHRPDIQKSMRQVKGYLDDPASWRYMMRGSGGFLEAKPVWVDSRDWPRTEWETRKDVEIGYLM